MADYHPLIARAVSRLKDNTPAARHVVYEQARIILIEQLRIRQPPASDSEIRRERATLEDAIRRVEADSLRNPVLHDERASTRQAKRVEGDSPLPIVKRRAIANAPLNKPTSFPEHQDHTIGSVKTAENFDTRRSLKAGNQNAQAFRSLSKPAHAILVDQPWIPQPRVIEKTDLKIETRSAPPAMPHAGPAWTDVGIANGSTSSASETAAKGCSTSAPIQFSPTDFPDNDKDLAESANGSLVAKLRGIKWLDQLIFDGSQPLAPHGLRQDVTTVLKWLNIEEPGTIETKHYDQFGRAIQRHMVQGRASLGGLAPPATMPHDLTLNEEIRGVFDRLLDREQSAMVFDHALMWFAKIWITVIVALNVAGMIGLVLSATTLWTGMAKLSEIWSPFNIWTWIAEAVALSPALGAMAWQDRRLRQPWLGSLKLRTRDLLKATASH